MDFKDIFDSLARYVGFYVDILRFRGLDSYARLEVVDSTLFSYFVIGLFLAYMIARTKTAEGYAAILEDEEPTGIGRSAEKLVEKVESTSLSTFVLISLAWAATFHLYLLLYSRLFGRPALGSIEDTINGTLAVNAILTPFNAVSLRVSRWANSMKRGNRLPSLRKFAGALSFLMALLHFGSFVYMIWTMASTHGLRFAELVVPTLSYTVVGIVLLLPVAIMMTKDRALRTHRPAT